MWPYLLSGLVGAIAMGKTKPKTPLRSMQCFGPRTGLVYTVEVMPGAANETIIVHAGDGSIALFSRNESGAGYHLLRPLRGSVETLARMKEDFEQ
jgi:hypothetical protein